MAAPRYPLSVFPPDPDLSILRSPLIGRFQHGGYAYEVAFWLPDDWNRLPEAERPGDAHALGCGCWYRVRVLSGPGEASA
jgi:hypothetical protein